ncbi:MAG: HYC_CC_PP family protein [Ginsengibacter sp.]
MKKIITILFLSVYALSVVGYSVKGIYCCDNLTSVKVSFSDNVHNHVVQSNDNKDCCKQKYQYFKIRDNYFPSHDVNAPSQLVAAIPVNFLSFKPVLFSSQKINIANPGNAPPLYHGVSLFIANCSYLI